MKAKQNSWLRPALVASVTLLVTAALYAAETVFLNHAAVREAGAQERRGQENLVLGWAVGHDDVPRAKAALKAGADPNARFSICQYLDFQPEQTPPQTPSSQACVDGPDHQPVLPLLIVARDADTIQTLLRAGANADIRSADGDTPLLFQARNGLDDLAPSHHEEYPVEAIRALLEGGADVHARDKDGNTALHLLWCRSQFRDCDASGKPYDYELQAAQEAVQALLRHGADVRATNKAGQTAMQVLDADFDASDTAPSRRAILAAMRQAVAGSEGFGYVVRPTDKTAALSHASSDRQGLENRRLAWAVCHDDVPGVQAALAAGADPNFRYPSWQDSDFIQDAPPTLTPQNTVAKHEEPETRAVIVDASPRLIRVLVHAGADVNVRNSDGETPLLYDVRSGNNGMLEPKFGPEKLIAALLQAGADVHARDKAGRTALHLVSFCSDKNHPYDNSKCVLAVIRLLVRHGASLSARDNYGETVWKSMDDCQDYGPENASKYRALLRQLGAREGHARHHSGSRIKT